MKDYINQILYDGLGYSLYIPVENKIKMIKNETIKKYLLLGYKCIYIFISLCICFVLFYFKL